MQLAFDSLRLTHFWMFDMKARRRNDGNQHLHRASPKYRDNGGGNGGGGDGQGGMGGGDGHDQGLGHGDHGGHDDDHGHIRGGVFGRH